ncbi:hypothetical protein ROZALSC1DRAFT_10797, partial [Rozella allomycis CSF55]
VTVGAIGLRAGINAYRNASMRAMMTGTSMFMHYPAGGFEAKMSRSEAAKILSTHEHAPLAKIKESHRRIMMLNHPDRGGSPYLASKINEARDMLERKR